MSQHRVTKHHSSLAGNLENAASGLFHGAERTIQEGVDAVTGRGKPSRKPGKPGKTSRASSKPKAAPHPLSRPAEDKLINTEYRKLLHRDADPKGESSLESAVKKLAEHKETRQIKGFVDATIESSPEYKRDQERDDAAYVASHAFHHVLERDPSPSELKAAEAYIGAHAGEGSVGNFQGLSNILRQSSQYQQEFGKLDAEYSQAENKGQVAFPRLHQYIGGQQQGSDGPLQCLGFVQANMGGMHGKVHPGDGYLYARGTVYKGNDGKYHAYDPNWQVVSKPQPGDAFIMLNNVSPDDGTGLYNGHAGLVDYVPKDGKGFVALDSDWDDGNVVSTHAVNDPAFYHTVFLRRKP